MKSLVLLVSVFALNAQATTYNYDCKCFATRGESRKICDGQENLKVSITSTGKYAYIELGSEDWELNESFKAKLDSEYRPRTLKNFYRYLTVEGGGGLEFTPDFLIEKPLKVGGYKIGVCDSKGGFVKAQYRDENGYVSFVNYACCLD